jgi:hypothetical protein
MDRLSLVDENTVACDLPADQLWRGLLAVVSGTSAGGRRFAGLLGCDPASATPSFTGVPGDAVPGFRVVDADPGRRLTLEGRHRFSRYRLAFRVDDGGVTAVTHAEFPGPVGRAYRGVVIGSGGHRIITRTLLRRVVRVAGRPGPPR